MKMWMSVLAALLGAGALAGQEPVPQEPTAQQPAPKDAADDARARVLAALAAGGIAFDAKAGTVAVPAVVNRPADLIEWILIHTRGKAHEAIFRTEVQPSLLNAAFLALGFEPGVNARLEPIEPPPTEAEIAQGADWARLLPPEGQQLWITVEWEQDGDEHRLPIEALLVDIAAGGPVEGVEWIYLGGQTAPLARNADPVFIADFEGNLVSSCYMHPPNHLVTVRHPRGRDDQNWWMTAKVPPPGTAVTVIFHRDKPQIVADYEQHRASAREQAAGEDAEAPEDGRQAQRGTGR